MATALLANLAMAGSDRALMLGLPGLAMLAAFALPTLRRSAAAAIDWFSMFFFTGAAITIWVLSQLPKGSNAIGAIISNGLGFALVLTFFTWESWRGRRALVSERGFLGSLLATVAGNLFDLREVGALRLVGLDLPTEFAERYPGPQFGVRGTRELVGRPSGTLLGTIIKPSIGLSLDDLADLVGELAEAGIDFIKDDELQGNPPSSPLAARVKVVTGVLNSYADKAGRKPMYAFNITDDIGRLEANHDLVAEAGGTAVMACVNTVGIAGIEFLRRHSVLPIHGHRTMFGAFSRSPMLGIDFNAFQVLARLAGVDHLHTNGIANKFYESDDEVLASIRAVRTPLFGAYETLPVLSSGQSAALAHRTYEAVGSTDILVMAGGGIHGHPDGSAAGVASMREAWDAAVAGEPLAERAARVPALARALELFAGRLPGAAR